MCDSSFWKYTLELYDRPSAPLELKVRMVRAEIFETKLRHVKPARVSLRHDAQREATSAFWLAASIGESTIIAPTTRFPIWTRFSYGDGKLEHRGDFTPEADLVRGIYGAHGGYETVKVRDVRRIGGARGLRGGTGKRVDGVFPGRPPQSFGINADQWTTAASHRTRGNSAVRRNKGRNVSWRNGSLHKKPGLDYSMQWYARTWREGPRRG